MDDRRRDEVLDEAGVQVRAAIVRAQELAESDGFWAAAAEVERLRVEIQQRTGLSVIEPAPPGVVDAVLDAVARTTVAQAAAFLTPRNDHSGVGGTVAS